MKIINSPNFDKRPENINIDTIVIHHTKMQDHLPALKRLCSPEAKASAHYLISKQGEIFSLVPDHMRAWHSGVSYWRGREKVNDFSIGIELDNNGEEEFSKELMQSLIKLCHQLIAIHQIDQFNIVGHSDIAPGRKDDPGALFDWKILAKNNIGVMPSFLLSAKTIVSKESDIIDDSVSYIAVMPEIRTIQIMLSQYGYKIQVTNKNDQQTIDVMKAFNEHFNPKCEGIWDLNSQRILQDLLRDI